MSNLVVVNGVNGYVENDVAFLKLEDVARGLGFTRTANSGNLVVMWSRVLKYVNEVSCANLRTEELPEYIPENVFYKLCMKANNEVARKFQDKVCNEILPSIRKHGAYITKETLEDMLSSPDFAIELLSKIKQEREEKALLEKELEAAAPKIEFHDAVSCSKNSITMDEAAKLLGTGRNKLYKLLRDCGVLRSDNLPYQQYSDLGYFEVQCATDSKPWLWTKTLVTGKGLTYIQKLIRKVSEVDVTSHSLNFSN